MNIEKKKFVTADDEADMYLEKQLALGTKSRGANILITALTMGFILAFAVLFWVMPDKDYSAEENRSLQAFPTFNSETFFSGKFTDEFSDYMADQFPLRNLFVGIKAVSETVQLKGENNDVVFGKDDYLIARNDYPDEDVLQKNISSAGEFISAAEKSGITTVAAFAGRKADTCDKYLPGVYGSYYSDRIWGITDTMTDEAGFAYLNLRDPLRSLCESGESVYYKNDHHWTSLGAYYGYSEIIKAFGETPYQLSDFSVESVTDDFYGTTWSSSGVKWVDGDEIDYYRWDGDTDFTMKILDDGGKFKDNTSCTYESGDEGEFAVFNSYYVREFLGEKDKYASFIGGNFGLTKITENNPAEPRETLLVVKDSFSHSAVQFLARHYDLVLVDLRYYKKSMLKYCTDNGISRVLMLYNMETLTEGAYLNVLRMGLGK